MSQPFPTPTRHEPCGCLRNATTGHALLVCSTHVRDVEGISYFRIRDESGELVLVQGRSPSPDVAIADRVAPEVAQAKLDAICEIVRASMPGVVREAFVSELSDLRNMVKTPAQRDSFSRGVWAGWDSLITQLISRLNEPRHSD